ncbi:MAG: ABC transporter permease, partial [Nitrososphaerales archaeon]
VFSNSVIFAGIATLVAFLFGIPIAWIVVTTNVPFKKLIEILALIPYIIPGIVFAIGWILLTDPTIGYLNIILMDVFGLKSAPLDIYTMFGMSWLGGFWSVPVVFLIVSGAFKNLDSSFDEAASICGASSLRRFISVTLPTIRPALIVSGILVFVRMLEDFVFPAIVGLPARIHTFPTAIYADFQRFQYGLATASSVLLLAIVAALLFFYSRAVRNQDRFSTVGLKGTGPKIRDIGKWKYVALFLILGFVFFSAILPMMIIAIASFLPIYSFATFSLNQLTTKFYVQLANDSITMQSLFNSIGLALAAATLTASFAFVSSYLNVRKKSKITGMLIGFSLVPLAFPGIVLAMGLLWAYIFIPIGIYGTIWILLVAYVTRFMPYAERVTSSSLAQISADMDDAAAVCGGGFVSRLRSIILPLTKSGFATAWIFVAANSIQELSASILLYSSNSQVAGVSILNLYDYNSFNELAALSTILTLILTALVIFVFRITRVNTRLTV